MDDRAPKKIYLLWYGENPEESGEDIFWSEDRINDTDEEYYHVSEIERLKKELEKEAKRNNLEIALNVKLIDERDLLRKEKEWISIDERLPENESNCDIYSVDGYRYTDVLWADYLDCRKHFFHEASDKLIYIEEVTHWRPLPNPPVQQALKEKE